jgi:probable HAF family extracellular repeat protein
MEIPMKSSAILGLMIFVVLFGNGAALADSFGFTTIDDPSATGDTEARGINNSGQIVGTFFDATGAHAFLDTAGVFTTIDYPRSVTA